MKKLIKAIIFLTLICCLSVCVSASNTVEISDNLITETDKKVDVKFTSDGFTEGDNLTLLVFKVTEEVSTPNGSNIVCLAQPEYTEGMDTVSFTLPDDAEGTYEVRLGGSNVSAYSDAQFTVGEIKGDLNNDGVLDRKDALVILQVFFGEITVDNMLDYDFTGDGKTDVKDAVELLKMI